MLAMASKKKYGYVEGNTVRKIQPAERPRRERRSAEHRNRQAGKEKVQYTNLLYTFFLAAAACMVLWSWVRYLQLQAETASHVKNIASMETQLEELRKENDDNYTRIMTSVDLDYIRDVAINELGMVYAEPDQVILYDNGTQDYVRQSGELPEEESSLADQILGK